MDIKKSVNIQGEREFQALSECVRNCLFKRYCTNDKKVEKLIFLTWIKFCFGESGHEGAFIVLDLFF